MCRWLNIPRSSYYYKAVKPVSEAELEENIKAIFLESKARYGARKSRNVWKMKASSCLVVGFVASCTNST
ncbi:hypothetical protein STRIC_1277 [Streptococcus ictaluri 707-05]|uniref:Uncharacterized protein n=1 Tax=Streptococcus ictaluri 707-05 TaxID=764299 RepID=G5K3A9_9STRE|nr:hypothetical protein STRIC_1277 [Streptococcus ictaluri 707-05]